MSRSRRGPALVVTLLVAGAGSLFLAAAVEPRPSGASALALVALAGAAAVVAAPGAMRRAVGVLVVVAGVAAVVVGVTAAAWWGVLGGAAMTVGGGIASWRGAQWSRPSGRYERGRRPDGTQHGLWDALDRGEDPTREPGDLPQ